MGLPLDSGFPVIPSYRHSGGSRNPEGKGQGERRGVIHANPAQHNHRSLDSGFRRNDDVGLPLDSRLRGNDDGGLPRTPMRGNHVKRQCPRKDHARKDSISRSTQSSKPASTL